MSQISKYLDQDFKVLQAQCLHQKKLFCDDKFPAAPSSLGYKELGPNTDKTKGVVWKRPGEMCTKPEYITSGATRTDLCQGELGDCWLVAAIASLTLNKNILEQAIFPEQNFKDNYAGIFHFQLWQYGKWVDVVIDDLLPTKNGKLMFVHSPDKTEFWSALLEKAYAKLNGSYEALKGGYGNEALEDFTGGIGENYTLSEAPQNLYSVMKKALSLGCMLGTSINPKNTTATESKTNECLVTTHLYSIIKAEEVHLGNNKVELVCLRNPWGNMEWNGPWSDKSKEWDQILPEEKTKLLNSAEDGEFWMTYADFKERYTVVEICNLTPDPPCTNYVEFHGSWKVGSTAGGCRNNKDTFSLNQQFVVKLNIDSDGDKMSSVLVALMQEGTRQAKQNGIEINAIGVEIYKLPDKYKGQKDVHLKSDELLNSKNMGSTKFTAKREVCGRFKLPLGEYIFIPCTFSPNKEASFMLRVFSEK